MSVLIKDMDMPFTCLTCDFLKWAGGVGDFCSLTKRRQFRFKNRPKDCPLIPVPPHYDLIDHNALKIAVMDCDAETRLDFLKHAMDCINKAPVVIPSDMPTYEAEEGET